MSAKHCATLIAGWFEETSSVKAVMCGMFAIAAGIVGSALSKFWRLIQGEMITLLGEYPSLTIGPALDSYQQDVEAIMRESLESEAKALAL